MSNGAGDYQPPAMVLGDEDKAAVAEPLLAAHRSGKCRSCGTNACNVSCFALCVVPSV